MCFLGAKNGCEKTINDQLSIQNTNSIPFHWNCFNPLASKWIWLAVSNIVCARNQPHRRHFSGCYCVPRSHVCTVCLPAKGAWTSPVSMEQTVLRSGWSSLPDHRQRSGLLPPDLPAGCGSGDWKRQESNRRNVTITISQNAANPLQNNSAH